MPSSDKYRLYRGRFHIGDACRVCRRRIDRAASRVGGRAVRVVCVCTGNDATSAERHAEEPEHREFIEFVVHVTPLFLSSDK